MYKKICKKDVRIFEDINLIFYYTYIYTYFFIMKETIFLVI